MNRKELYEKTINVLLDAYNESKLFHGSCKACAVGNICAGDGRWGDLFMTSNGKQFIEDSLFMYNPNTFENKKIHIKDYKNYVNKGFRFDYYYYWYSSSGMVSGLGEYIGRKFTAKKLIKSTGYTIKELMAIEFAFETCERDDNEKQYQFNGLVAVLDKLKEIHEVDVPLAQESQAKLIKIAKETFSLELV